MNIGALSARHGRARADHAALVTDRVRLTFRDFDRRTARLAAALQRHGIGRGDAIATALPNGAAISAAALACWINDRVAARYQRVSGVAVLDEFPRNTAGKTLNRELRAPYWAARATPV